jgi:CrcB protein
VVEVREQEVLPTDSDVDFDRDSVPSRPSHWRFGAIALVAIGGTAGTASREGVGMIISSLSGISMATLAVNVAGALMLGVLLETLVRSGADTGARRTVRLLLGTGFLGGFTTYSTLAVGTAALVVEGSIWFAVAYCLGTVVVGAAATFAGIAVTHGIRSRGGSR